jgi:hypothetical protein
VSPGTGWFAVKGQLQGLTRLVIDFGLRDAISNFNIVAPHAVNGDVACDFINRRERCPRPLAQHESSAVFTEHRFDLLVSCEFVCIGFLDAFVNVTNLPGFILHTVGCLPFPEIKALRRKLFTRQYHGKLHQVRRLQMSEVLKRRMRCAGGVLPVWE